MGIKLKIEYKVNTVHDLWLQIDVTYNGILDAYILMKQHDVIAQQSELIHVLCGEYEASLLILTTEHQQAVIPMRQS